MKLRATIRRRSKGVVAAALVLAFCLSMSPRALADETKSAASGSAVDFDQVSGQLNTQIANKRSQIDQLNKQIGAYQKAIEAQRQEEASIGNEIAILDNKIAQTELDIKSNQLEIDSTGLEINGLQAQIQDKTLKMMKQRGMIAEFLRQINKTDQTSAIDLFLTQQTLSDFFNDAQFLQESQRELKSALDTVKVLKADLEDRQAAETAKKKHLEDIQAQLAQDRDQLNEDKTAKGILVQQAQQTEARYSYELAQLKRQVADVNNDIVDIEKRLRKTLDDKRIWMLSGGTSGWMWPVDPIRGITAYFHDPDYPFRYVFEHPAVDIRIAQGTPIRAARGGYVARAHNGGMGYSYVMLIHDNDVATVYGHVSRIVVKEDTYVEKGEIIAYSGGMPGTPGAGPLTTGPHLHLEFRVDGIPVDPLGYLKL